MTPHWRIYVDFELSGRAVAQRIFVAPSGRHLEPFQKRRAGHRRRADRKFRIATKRSYLDDRILG